MDLKSVHEVINDENFPILKAGTICLLSDLIDPAIMYNVTVKLIEPDPELKGIVYYYLRANTEELNDKIEPRFGWTYFDIVSNTDVRLCPVGAPTVQ